MANLHDITNNMLTRCLMEARTQHLCDFWISKTTHSSVTSSSAVKLSVFRSIHQEFSLTH